MDPERRAELEQEIRNLQSELTSSASPAGDWKLNKYVEYQEQGKPSPYTPEEMEEYFAARQEKRDRINEIQEILDRENE